MAILTEGARKAEFLISEAESYRSRDQVSVAVWADSTYEAGYVMGKVTSSGNYVRLDPANNNGSEVPVGVLFQTLTNMTDGAVDMEATLIARAAQVRQADLMYPEGATAEEIATTNAALNALGIVVR